MAIAKVCTVKEALSIARAVGGNVRSTEDGKWEVVMGKVTK